MSETKHAGGRPAGSARYTKSITVSVTPAALQRLKEIAAGRDVDLSIVVREAIDLKIAADKPE